MKKRNKYLFLGLITTACGILCFLGFSFARYVSTSVWDYYLKSKGFYFSSDYLGSKTLKNVDNFWDGESVNFNIKNNLNQTVVTNNDINYNVTCEIEGEAKTYASCNLNGTNSNELNGVLAKIETCINETEDGKDVSSLNKTACELGGYEWKNQVAIKDFYFDVDLTDEEYELTDVVVNVVATSISPYRKTLSGKFILHKNDLITNIVTMSYKNYSNYDILTVSNTHSTSKCIKITWDSAKLKIDTLNNSFSSYSTDSDGYINEIKLNIESKRNKNYRFYRDSFKTLYDINEFTLEESSEC